MVAAAASPVDGTAHPVKWALSLESKGTWHRAHVHSERWRTSFRFYSFTDQVISPSGRSTLHGHS